ncbi:MAG: DUF7453 family protein [Phycisphaerales bacterium]
MPTGSCVTAKRSVPSFPSRLAAIAALLAAAGSALGQAQLTITPVLLPGAQAPGLPTDFTLGGGFFPPVADVANGKTAFLGFLQGPAVTVGIDDSVIYAGDLASLAPAARGNDPAPATEVDTVFDGFNGTVVAGGGRIAFTGILFGPNVGAQNAAIFHGVPGELGVAMRQAAQAPGTATGILFNFRANDTAAGQGDSTFNSLRLGLGGHVAFISDLQGPGVVFGGSNPSDAGIWGGLPGAVAKIARRGDPAPGTAAGINYLNVLPPVVTPSGNLAYVAQLVGPGVVAGVNRAGIWAGPLASPTKVIRGGEPAPGLPGLTIRGFNAPDMNDSNVIAWRGSFDGPGVILSTPPPPAGTIATDSALFLGPAGNMDVLCRMGLPAPLINDPGVLLANFTLPVVNAAGDAAFIGVLAGTGITLNENDEVLYVGRPGNLRIAARAGTQMPGAEPGVMMSGFSNPSMNAGGRLLLVVFLSGAGVVTGVGGNDQVIAMIDPSSGVVPLIRRGDPLQVGPGELRIVDTFGLLVGSGGQDGRRTSLFDDGRAVFNVQFIDLSFAMFTGSIGTRCNAADVASLGGAPTPDGQNTADDVIVFLGAFFSGDLAIADIAQLGGTPGADGQLTADDIILFLSAFFAPCG